MLVSSPGRQPRIGVIGVREGSRIVGIAGRNCLAPRTFRTGQRVGPQAEPFIANQAPDLRGGGHQRIAHRDLRVFTIPEQALAVAEQLVAAGIKELRKRVR
jgi:hypothetical protein